MDNEELSGFVRTSPATAPFGSFLMFSALTLDVLRDSMYSTSSPRSSSPESPEKALNHTQGIVIILCSEMTPLLWLLKFQI